MLAENKLRPTKVQHEMPKELHVTADNAATKATRQVWIPPTDFDIKINVDGGVSRCGRRGAAAVICRDKAGAFLGASARVFEGLTDPPSLEAQACNEALALAQDLKLSHMVIASDCMQVVTDIKGSTLSSYALVIDEIKESMNDFVKISFRYECREANFEAHAIAKAASAFPPGRRLWLGILPDIACIALALNVE